MRLDRLRVGAVFICLLVVGATAQARDLPEFTTLVKENTPAVVNISTTQKVAPDSADIPELPNGHPLKDFLDRFFHDQAPQQFDAESLGSGFIISADGYILTNNHVVEDATQIIVRLSDRREFEAKLVGSDQRSDLAVLKIDATSLPVVAIGKSSDLQVGEWVLAIGSPFGFEHSVTAGIVSAKGRNLPTENYVPFIQTDVAINPGNSGGPLINMKGEVVGVNSHIYSRTGGFMGLSFAIPIELAMNVVRQIRETGYVTRGWLGVMIQDVTRELAASFGMDKSEGALVAQVIPDSPAKKAGIRVGDVIVEFDGREIATSSALPPMVGNTPAGRTVDVKVIRDGRSQSLKVTLGVLPEASDDSGQDSPAAPPGRNERLGLSVGALDTGTRESLGLDPQDGGVLVTKVEDGGIADAAGLRPGDVITMFDRHQVGNVGDFHRLVDAVQDGRSVAILVRREDGPRFLALQIPK